MLTHLQAVVKCKIQNGDAYHRALLLSLRTLVFFGTPHRGMETDDIELYLQETFAAESTGEARKNLVAELRCGNPGVERELQDFKDLVGQDLQVQIVSIYERKPSQRLVRTDQRSGMLSSNHAGTPSAWRREGEAYISLTDNSALLGFPAWLETRIPSDSNHSNMTKFDHKDLTYQLLVEELRKVPQGFVSDAFPWVTNNPDASSQRSSNWRELLKLVSSVVGACDQSSSNLSEAADQVRKILAESQILIELAEAFTCRAILEGKRAQALEVRFVMADEGLHMRSALQVVKSRFAVRSMSSNSPEPMLNGLQDLATHALRLNSKLESLLGAEPFHLYSTAAMSLGPHHQEAVNSLISMKLLSEGEGCRSLGIPEESEIKWIPFHSLYFPAEPAVETHRAEGNWLQRILQSLTAPESSGLRLKPRRFGALKTKTGFQNVMVEFRPYPQQDSAGSELHALRRRAFTSIAQMVLCSRQGPVKFPSVPLLYISEMESSQTPCFLFVYAAEQLFGLDEALHSFVTPSVKERIWLALCYAKAIAALHAANICHGLVNPFNLYLQAPKSSMAPADGKKSRLEVHQAAPMLAGFDISRSVFGCSDLIDVEDQDWRVYLHVDRLRQGYDKDLQNPKHDVFSLGMVLTVIGLWTAFTSFKKYQGCETDRQRQEFSAKLRKQFQGNGSSNTMPSEYRDIISYCLGRHTTLPGESVDIDEEPLLSLSEVPKASRAVNALMKVYERLS